jgi:hypothetical protein
VDGLQSALQGKDRGADAGRVGSCQQHLGLWRSRLLVEKKLFQLNPVFWTALLRVRAACWEMGCLQLHGLQTDRPCTLEEMEEQSSRHMQVIGVTQGQAIVSDC